MALAAVSLYRATGEDAYLDDATALLGAVNVEAGLNPYYYVGPLAAADLCGGLGRPAVPRADVRQLACRTLAEGAEAAVKRSALTAFGSPGEFYFGWVQGHAGNAALTAAAERAGVVTGGRELAAGARDYLRGRNPWGADFVVGPGANAVHAPYHPLFLAGDPVALGRGLVVGGPAIAGQLPEFGITPNPSDRFAPFTPTYENDFYWGRIVYEDQPGTSSTARSGSPTPPRRCCCWHSSWRAEPSPDRRHSGHGTTSCDLERWSDLRSGRGAQAMGDTCRARGGLRRPRRPPSCSRRPGGGDRGCVRRPDRRARFRRGSEAGSRGRRVGRGAWA